MDNNRKKEKLNFLIFSGIGRKIFIALLILSLLPLFLAIYQGYTITRKALKSRILNQIETVSLYISTNIEHFIREQEISIASVFSSNQYMLNNVEIVQEPARSKRRRQKAAKDLNEFIKKLQEEDNFGNEYFVLGTDGKIIASVNPALIGMDRSKTNYYKKGSIKTSLTISYNGTVPTITISTPIKTTGGAFLGVFAAKLSNAKLFALLDEGKKLGKTSRIYFANPSYAILTEYDKGIQNEVRNTEEIIQALNKKIVTGSFIRENKRRIVGTYRLIPKTGWILCCELDEIEAFQPLNKLRNQAITFCIVFFFIIAWTAYYISLNISKPLMHLSEAAREIGKGNFSKRVTVSTKDEVNEMAKSFNLMAQKLEESYSHLEHLVEEKTKELKENIAFTNNMLESISVGIFAVDTDFNITAWNRYLEEISGIKANSIEGERITKFIPEEEHLVLINAIKETIEKNVTVKKTNLSLPFMGKGVFDLIASPLKGDNKNLAGAVIFIEDVTEKRALEEKLIRHQQYIANISENSADAIISLDKNNIITTWNKGAEEMYGYKKEEIIGKSFDILIPEDLREKGEMEWIIKETEKRGALKNYETERITKSGKRIYVALTRTLLKDNNNNPIGCSVIVRDITEKKNLERQLIQSEKLSAVGELTAGLAHEIGTPLNIISGRAEYILSLAGDNPKINEGLKSIIRQIDRITSLIQQLLKFTRSEKKETKGVNVNTVIEDTLLLLETKLDKSRIVIEKNIDNNILLIEGDENQIQQVFINLFINAIHAMPEGGKLSIKTKSNKAQNMVEIVISDTGIGIEEKNISRIFDPFFTTKEIGKGTGLGLAVTYGIIKDHGGNINVKSIYGKGTEFFITLPGIKKGENSKRI
ncbi:MAG: PAS domain S-box protein [Candidatus Schekmanbacteria bacterium]|nr:MAG: PAS domain S-box protein [Candidatus Schekmanbacteria bacterium]